MSADTTFVRVCALADIAPGKVAAVRIGDTPVAVAHTKNGQVFAVYDECSHARVALSEGEIDGCALECCLHGAQFDLRTGEPTNLPATEPIPTYPVEIRDGDVYVSLAPSNGVHR